MGKIVWVCSPNVCYQLSRGDLRCTKGGFGIVSFGLGGRVSFPLVTVASATISELSFLCSKLGERMRSVDLRIWIVSEF